MKSYAGRYLLSVTRVDNQPLSEPLLLEFSVPGFVDVELANDDFDFYELNHGKRIGRLNSNQVQALQNDYVGKQVRLAVYETGGFSGIPGNLPDDVPVWQDHAFGFSARLVVLAERE